MPKVSYAKEGYFFFFDLFSLLFIFSGRSISVLSFLYQTLRRDLISSLSIHRCHYHQPQFPLQLGPPPTPLLILPALFHLPQLYHSITPHLPCLSYITWMVTNKPTEKRKLPTGPTNRRRHWVITRNTSHQISSQTLIVRPKEQQKLKTTSEIWFMVEWMGWHMWEV